MRCSVLPPQSNFIRKATVCLLSFIPICAESEAVSMVIFMILTISIIIAIVLHILYTAEYISKKNFCLWIGVMVFVLLGLRSTSTGGDTQIYYHDFLSINTDSLSSTIANSPMKDVGFIIFEWLVKRIGGTFRTVLLINALLFGIAIGKMFYRRSDDPGLSYVLLFSFNIFQFSLSGLRQTFAIAFVIFALMLYEDKKYVKSSILILLAGAFHLSAFILVIIPVIQFLYKTPKRIKYSIPIILAVFLLRNQMAVSVGDILFSIIDRMSNNVMPSSSGLTMTLVIMMIYVFSALFAVQYCNENARGIMDFSLMLFAVLFEALVPANPIFFRIAFYTLWIIAIFVPRIVQVAFTKSSRLIVNIAAYAIALMMYFGFTMNSVVGGYHFL